MNGHVIGKTNGTGHLVIMAFPVKVSVGKSEVDLNVNTTVVSIEGKYACLTYIAE